MMSYRRYFRVFPLVLSVGWIAPLFAVQADHWTLTLDDGQSLAKDSTGKITDGEWTLLVRFNGDGTTADKRTLHLGSEQTAGSSTIYGSAYLGYSTDAPQPRLDERAGPLDLDKPVHYNDQTDWKITALGPRCLAVGNSTESGNKTEWLTSLRVPSALTSWGYEMAKCNPGGSQLGAVIVDVPSLKGELSQYSFFGHKGITNFVLKAPNVTSVGKCFLYSADNGGLSATDASQWDLRSVTQLKGRALARLGGIRGTLRLPRLATAAYDGSYGAFQGSGFEAIEIGDSAESAIDTDMQAFQDCARLRKVTIGGNVDVTIGTNAFKNCGALVSVRIGTADSPVVSLKKTAFNVCTSIEEVILGGRDQLYFEDAPFCFCKLDSEAEKAVAAKLSRLRFLGVAPTLGPAITTGTAMWGNFGKCGHLPEKQVTVEIPANSASWTAFFANTTLGQPTDVETNAYHAAWKTRAIPYGVIPESFQPAGSTSGSPLGFKNKQYLAVGDRTALPQLGCEGDGRYGDKIVLSYSSDGYESDEDGTIPYGAPCDKVTLTASTTGSNCAFVRWYYGGAITAENQRTNPLVLSFDAVETRGVYGAAFQHDWLFDAAAKTISDGVWKLNAYPIDAAAHSLRIGRDPADCGEGWKTSNARGHAFTGIGSGKLDLSGSVSDGNGQKWSIEKIDDYALGSGTQTESVKTNYASEIVFPEGIKTFGQQILNRGTGSLVLRTVVLEAPDLTTLGTWTFAFQGIRRLVLRVPQVTSLPEAAFGSNHKAGIDTVEAGMQNPLDLTDAGEWDLSGVTSCDGRRTFSLNCLLRGTLRLPLCTSITDKGERVHGFLENAQVIDGVELATDTDALDIATGAFRNSKMKNLVIGARRTLTVGADAFAGCSALTNLTCYGKAPGKAAVDEILSGVTVPTGGSKNCTIRASARMGWQAYASSCTPEEDPPSDAGFLGVYATLAGDRKAWIVNEIGKWEPKGLMMLFR